MTYELDPAYLEEMKAEIRHRTQPDELPKLLVPSIITALALMAARKVV